MTYLLCIIIHFHQFVLCRLVSWMRQHHDGWETPCVHHGDVQAHLLIMILASRTLLSVRQTALKWMKLPCLFSIATTLISVTMQLNNIRILQISWFMLILPGEITSPLTASISPSITLSSSESTYSENVATLSPSLKGQYYYRCL